MFIPLNKVKFSTYLYDTHVHISNAKFNVCFLYSFCRWGTILHTLKDNYQILKVKLIMKNKSYDIYLLFLRLCHKCNCINLINFRNTN